MVHLGLVDHIYNKERDRTNDRAEHDVIGLNDMKCMTKFLGEEVKLRASGRVLRLALHFAVCHHALTSEKWEERSSCGEDSEESRCESEESQIIERRPLF